MKIPEGIFSLGFEGDTEDWSGHIVFPKQPSSKIEYKIFSNEHKPESPISHIGSHQDKVVPIWLDRCRPVTLVEPMQLGRGLGPWMKGYRFSRTGKGICHNAVFDTHIEAKSAVVQSVSVSSSAMGYLLSSSIEEDLRDPHESEHFSRQEYEQPSRDGDYVRISRVAKKVNGIEHGVPEGTLSIRFSEPIDVIAALSEIRLLRATCDFLFGKPDGEMKLRLTVDGTLTAPVLLEGNERNFDFHRQDLMVKSDQPFRAIATSVAVLRKESQLVSQLFAVTQMIGEGMSFMEGYLRSMAFFEAWLPEENENPAIVDQQREYREGIQRFNQRIDEQEPEISSFYKTFCVARYPTGRTLKEKIQAKLDTLRERGLKTPENYAADMVELRNACMHGDEDLFDDFLERVQFAKEVITCALELDLFTKLGFVSGVNVHPRSDRLGYQRGIWR